ncbi:MAG TPA: hypothetical protein VFX96_02340, partial [Pyrinomonadaceae bacterium]|nr:hypothetical protein [Pyrinomonadaceae bacterium]
GEYRVRAASLEEWERARKVEAMHHPVEVEELYDGRAGARRIQRPFTKTGALWGMPRAVSGEWLAVFSYTPDVDAAGARLPRGALHIEVYDAPPGDLINSARRPYTGSPDALFARALWLDRHFLVVPLDESYNSLLLWLLPETGGML